MKPEQLNPGLLWKHFSSICSIPHPSGHLEGISRYVKLIAERNNLQIKTDEAGNILVSKPASKGRENLPVITLQSHLDMVPQKNSRTEHDFIKDPVKTYVDGEWLKAQGTTLGADNGIGVAASLAAMEDSSLRHGPLEMFFTVDEETGMVGSLSLKEDFLKGKILMNLDSEHEGEIFIGCAGGVEAKVVIPVSREPLSGEKTALKIALRGLRGGHSGLDIHLGRGNALKILAEIIAESTEHFDIALYDLYGGTVSNAIPREAFCTVALPKNDLERFKQFCLGSGEKFKNELGLVDPNISVELTETEKTDQSPLTVQTQNSLLRSLLECPNGVTGRNSENPDLVETSLNLALIHTEEKCIEAVLLLRSSNDSSRDRLAQRLQTLFKAIGAEVYLYGEYPGWQPDFGSRVVDMMKRCYKSLFDDELKVSVVHAGLECGIIGSKYPKMELVSFGPTIRFPHSPDESVHIPSVGRFWSFLVQLLNCAGKYY
ncbi:Aminoacyl-histidine dipeptidase (Peptidase D) [Chitinispirillum alkaliphilum]|nr:Aminoacyl-histidine dipeptidase (Peptidase D) [Chitinispirillum alkaliphilum]